MTGYFVSLEGEGDPGFRYAPNLLVTDSMRVPIPPLSSALGLIGIDERQH